MILIDASQRTVMMIGAAVALLVMGLEAMRLASSSSHWEAASARSQQIESQVTRIEQLRSQQRGSGIAREADPDVIGRIQRALVEAGLPITAITSVQPRADQVTTGSPVRMQTVQCSLHNFAPSDLGAWLAAWSNQSGSWSCTELQMLHVAGAPGNPSDALDLNRYDITLLLASPYLQDAP